MSIIRDKNAIEIELFEAIKLNLKELRGIVQHCGLEEFYYFLSAINFQYQDRNVHKPTPDERIIDIQNIDVYKYILSFMTLEGVFESEATRVPNNLLIEALSETVKIINSKFQGINYLYLFSDIELDQSTELIKINISEIKTNDKIQKINDYFIRIQNDLEEGLESKSLNQALTEFEDEFGKYNDLFESLFEITVYEFKQWVKMLIHRFQDRFTELDGDYFTYTEEMLIDSSNLSNYINFSKLLLFSKNELLSLNPNISKTIELFTFNSDEFDPLELRFDQISKTPILKIGKKYIISIELLIGSFLLNTHYLLMNNKSTSEAYKKRLSNQFEEQIAQVAGKYGYKVIERNLMLYEGKNRIGDVDLILENDSESHRIHVESKCCSLHANIQAHDSRTISKTLEFQKKDWEYKVLRRKSKLISQTDSDIEYLIVTKKPEILGHFSDILVLTLSEFETYLIDKTLTFNEIIKNHYNIDRPNQIATFRKIYPSIYPLKDDDSQHEAKNNGGLGGN